MNDKLVEITGVIDGFMYTYILVIMLVVAGVYFTLRTRGVQIRFIKVRCSLVSAIVKARL